MLHAVYCVRKYFKLFGLECRRIRDITVTQGINLLCLSELSYRLGLKDSVNTL